jgi:hypothetical protein
MLTLHGQLGVRAEQVGECNVLPLLTLTTEGVGILAIQHQATYS